MGQAVRNGPIVPSDAEKNRLRLHGVERTNAGVLAPRGSDLEDSAVPSQTKTAALNGIGKQALADAYAVTVLGCITVAGASETTPS